MRKIFFREEMGEEKFLWGGNGRGKVYFGRNEIGKFSFWRKWVRKGFIWEEMGEEKFLLGGNG